MTNFNLPVTLSSFEIKYDDDEKMYSAIIFYTAAGGKLSIISSNTKWGQFEDAKKWVEETTGLEIK